MKVIDARAIRNRVACNLSPQTANAVGFSFSELYGFLNGSRHFDDETLLAIAGFLKMKQEDIYR